jgi:hypothetical protein
VGQTLTDVEDVDDNQSHAFASNHERFEPIDAIAHHQRRRSRQRSLIRTLFRHTIQRQGSPFDPNENKKLLRREILRKKWRKTIL